MKFTLVLILCCLIADGVYLGRDYFTHREWEARVLRVPATIEDVRIISTRRAKVEGIELMIDYRYLLDGQERRSSRLFPSSLGDRGNEFAFFRGPFSGRDDRELSKKLYDKYRVGQSISIYYDPVEPEQTSLFPRRRETFPPVCTIVLVNLLVLRSIRKKRKVIEQKE